MRQVLCFAKACEKCEWGIRELDLAAVQKCSSFRLRQPLLDRQSLDPKNRSDALTCSHQPRQLDNRVPPSRENIAGPGLEEYGLEHPGRSTRPRSNPPCGGPL